MGKYTGIKCPKCGKKGLHHPDILFCAYSYSYKDYDKVTCRWCRTFWNTKDIEQYIEQ